VSFKLSPGQVDKFVGSGNAKKLEKRESAVEP